MKINEKWLGIQVVNFLKKTLCLKLPMYEFKGKQLNLSQQYIPNFQNWFENVASFFYGTFKNGLKLTGFLTQTFVHGSGEVWKLICFQVTIGLSFKENINNWKLCKKKNRKKNTNFGCKHGQSFFLIKSQVPSVFSFLFCKYLVVLSVNFKSKIYQVIFLDFG